MKPTVNAKINSACCNPITRVKNVKDTSPEVTKRPTFLEPFPMVGNLVETVKEFKKKTAELAARIDALEHKLDEVYDDDMEDEDYSSSEELESEE